MLKNKPPLDLLEWFTSHMQHVTCFTHISTQPWYAMPVHLLSQISASAFMYKALPRSTTTQMTFEGAGTYLTEVMHSNDDSHQPTLDRPREVLASHGYCLLQAQRLPPRLLTSSAQYSTTVGKISCSGNYNLLPSCIYSNGNSH